MPIIVSTHPRTRKKIVSTKSKFNSLVKLMKPMSFSDYVKLQKTCFFVLSDSGSITEETSILNLKSLNIRETNERQEGMEEATVPMVGLNIKRIDQTIKFMKNKNKILKLKEYIAPNLSDKIIKIIYSYVDYVNWKVWSKRLDK